jgi:hypothetical protein
MKLSHAQLVVLSAASQRADHAIQLPASLKGGAARKVKDFMMVKNQSNRGSAEELYSD